MNDVIGTPEGNGRDASLSPVELARAAFRRIAELRIPPTPENYQRLYLEAAALPQPPSQMGQTLVRRVEDLVKKASATTENLATHLGQKNDDISQALDQLAAAESATASSLLLEVVSSARDIQLTARASYAELLDAKRSLAEIKAELADSHRLLVQDPLTGTENRRAMASILDREMARARRLSEPLSVVMIDLDHFKSINDTYGHEAGDSALVHLTNIAKEMLRGNDAFIRYGGEEFLLVLPQAGLQSAAFTSDRLRAALGRQPLTFDGKIIAMTFSAGAAVLENSDTAQTLLRRADGAMYEAKRAGRNRTVIAA